MNAFGKYMLANIPSLATLCRVSVYVLMVLFVEFGKEFQMMGADNLRKYDFYNWLICSVSSLGAAFIVINSYFDKTAHTTKEQQKEESTPPTNQEPPKV